MGGVEWELAMQIRRGGVVWVWLWVCGGGVTERNATPGNALTG